MVKATMASNSALASPEPAETLPVPSKYRCGLDDCQGTSPGSPVTAENHPQAAVPGSEARTPVSGCAGEDPDLMTQREVLQGELAPRLE